jgi:N-acyl homoserine lactone hydrolase
MFQFLGEDDEPECREPDAEAIRASTNQLLDLVERETVGLVIFGHEPEQWEGLKKLREYYE